MGALPLSGGMGVAPILALGASPKDFGRAYIRKLRKRRVTKIRRMNSGAHYDIAPEFLCNLEQLAQKNAASGCAYFTKKLNILDRSELVCYNNKRRQ